MKKICFTLCSNNYLTQASLLITSFFEHNKDYLFVVGLVDEINSTITYPKGENIEIIPCAHVVPKDTLDYMIKVYKIVELNTAVKPFFFNYFFNSYKDCTVIYLDPDIYVYQSFSVIEKILLTEDFVITPHCLTPIPLDSQVPQERAFIKYGVYNLGFMAMINTLNTQYFVKWLMERLATYCYMETEIGVYVDQSWINFLPIFFNKVNVSKHFGLNCAFWNLHERNYSQKENQYWVNKEFPLVFFHFSSFPLHNYQQFTKEPTRFNGSNRLDVLPLFQQYVDVYKKALVTYSNQIPCVYTQRTFKQKIVYYLNRYQIRKALPI